MRTLPTMLLIVLAVFLPQSEVEDLWPDGSVLARYEVKVGPDGEKILHGEYQSFHQNGEKHETGAHEDGERVGKWTIRWMNGKRREFGKYVGGKREGKWRTFNDKGKKATEGVYEAGRRTGEWTAFDAKGKVVKSRSGIVKFHEGSRGSTGLRWTGETLAGKRDGEWKCFREDGSLAASGEYVAGCPMGAWLFFLADGSFEPNWLSGVYSQCKRERGVKDAPPTQAGTSKALRVKGEAEDVVGLWLENPSTETAAAVLTLPKQNFPALVNALVACDLEQRSGWELGKRIHEELLSRVFGSIGEWTDFGAEGAAEKNARLGARWRAVWELAGTTGEYWVTGMRPEMKDLNEFLTNGSLPGAKWSGPSVMAGGVIGIGGGAGGKFGARFGGRRSVRASGGAGTEEALADGLAWLAAHQSPDGSWDNDGFLAQCGHVGKGECDGPGDAIHDVGVTGLALLALIGDGNTTREGKYKESVLNGIKWLRQQQNPTTGLFGKRLGHGFHYDHGIASLAMSEAYYFSKNPLLKGTTQKAIDYIVKARNPYGVWRYDFPPQGDNDTCLTGWMVFALRSAEEAGLTIDEKAFADTLQWLDQVTDASTGRAGYDDVGTLSARIPQVNDHYPAEKGEAMTAVSLLCRFFLGQSPDEEPIMSKHADLMLKTLPEWDMQGNGCDMYYWYYGSYAMYQMGGRYWKAWNAAMKKTVVDNQRRDGDYKGSWDPIGPWGFAGGRIYSTAMMSLCLESYFRYAKVSGR